MLGIALAGASGSPAPMSRIRALDGAPSAGAWFRRSRRGHDQRHGALAGMVKANVAGGVMPPRSIPAPPFACRQARGPRETYPCPVHGRAEYIVFATGPRSGESSPAGAPPIINLRLDPFARTAWAKGNVGSYSYLDVVQVPVLAPCSGAGRGNGTGQISHRVSADAEGCELHHGSGRGANPRSHSEKPGDQAAGEAAQDKLHVLRATGQERRPNHSIAQVS